MWTKALLSSPPSSSSLLRPSSLSTLSSSSPSSFSPSSPSFSSLASFASFAAFASFSSSSSSSSPSSWHSFHHRTLSPIATEVFRAGAIGHTRWSPSTTSVAAPCAGVPSTRGSKALSTSADPVAAECDDSKKKVKMTKELSKLVKAELSLLVVITNMGGFLIGGGSIYAIAVWSPLVVGTALFAGCASMMNQLMEISYDRIMLRTRNRPLVTGTISVRAAQGLAFSSCVGGTVLLTSFTSPITTALGLLTIALYAGAYTPLKRVSKWNTEVGAVVGALPPIMGWAAAVHTTPGLTDLEVGHISLVFALMFSWQMHHFMTIAWQRRDDYSKAGYWMQSRNDSSGVSTTRLGAAYAGVCVALPWIFYHFQYTTLWNPVLASLYNVYFIKVYHEFYRDRTNKSARKALVAGIVQLMWMFILMCLCVNPEHHSGHVIAYTEVSELADYAKQHCLFIMHKKLGLPKMCPVPPEMPQKLRALLDGKCKGPGAPKSQ